MGRRGPKADEYGDKSQVLSTRITRETRTALDGARKKSGRTMSSEVEYRLRRSFEEDRRIAEHLGGRQLFGILQIIAASLTSVGEGAFSARTGKLGTTGEWLNDPFAYGQAVRATMAVMKAFNPPGDPSPPTLKVALKAIGKKVPAQDEVLLTRTFKRLLSHLGADAAAKILGEVREAKPTLPALNERVKPDELRARRIRSNLGRLHGRLNKKEPAK